MLKGTLLPGGAPGSTPMLAPVWALSAVSRPCSGQFAPRAGPAMFMVPWHSTISWYPCHVGGAIPRAWSAAPPSFIMPAWPFCLGLAVGVAGCAPAGSAIVGVVPDGLHVALHAESDALDVDNVDEDTL